MSPSELGNAVKSLLADKNILVVGKYGVLVSLLTIFCCIYCMYVYMYVSVCMCTENFSRGKYGVVLGILKYV
jgi:hypothetical protein